MNKFLKDRYSTTVTQDISKRRVTETDNSNLWCDHVVQKEKNYEAKNKSNEFF